MESQGRGAVVADVLRPLVPRLTDEVLAQVVAAVPPFHEWWGGRLNVRDGVEQGLGGLLAALESGVDDRGPALDVFFDFGRSERRAGRGADAVLAAYRVGAQAAWRGMAAGGDAAGVEPRALYALADAIFAYVDRLCAATLEGHAYERSLEAAPRVDARRRLVELAVRPADGDPEGAARDLAGAAADAAWRLPARLAVVAFRGERTGRVAARLPADAQVARVDGLGWAIVGDPDGPGRPEALRQGLCGVRAGVGPAVAVRWSAESAGLARRALALAEHEGTGGAVFAEDRRVDLLLLSDPGLARGLVDDVLSPLARTPAAVRERLFETLSAWLEHQGEVRPTAVQLHVHTQTVRYRVAQLRELLVDRMASPEGRLELELALRARRLGGA